MVTTGPNLAGRRVFVSYPRGGLGHTWAEEVQSHLGSLGAEVWRDEDAIREGWREARFDPRNLIRLASNPYLLFVMTEITIKGGRIPENRIG